MLRGLADVMVLAACLVGLIVLGFVEGWLFWILAAACVVSLVQVSWQHRATSRRTSRSSGGRSLRRDAGVWSERERDRDRD